MFLRLNYHLLNSSNAINFTDASTTPPGLDYRHKRNNLGETGPESVPEFYGLPEAAGPSDKRVIS